MIKILCPDCGNEIMALRIQSMMVKINCDKCKSEIAFKIDIKVIKKK